MTLYLTTAERPLSPTEHVIWAADEVCSFNFAMHFEVHGMLDETRVRAALQQVQNRHPLLRMRMVDEGAQAWFRTDGVGPIPLRIVDGSPERLVPEAEYEVQTRFDCQRGPLVRCVWIRHAPDHATLLLTIHHSIGDGTSGALLIRDFLRALSGETLTMLPLAEPLDRHLPLLARGLRGFIGYLKILAKTVGWIVRKGKPKSLPLEGAAAAGARRARLRFMRFDRNFVAALTARARIEGTTVHGALSAAIVLSALADNGAERTHVLFCSPINLRDRLMPPIGDDVGFFVTGGYSSHIVSPHQEFWALARELKRGLNAAIDDGLPYFGLTGLSPGLMFLHRLAGGGAKGRQAAARGLVRTMEESFALTNIGRVKIESRYGGLGVSTVGFIASTSFACSNACFTATHDGILTFNHLVMEPLISAGTQDKVCERIRTILNAAVEGA